MRDFVSPMRLQRIGIRVRVSDQANAFDQFILVRCACAGKLPHPPSPPASVPPLDPNDFNLSLSSCSQAQTRGYDVRVVRHSVRTCGASMASTTAPPAAQAVGLLEGTPVTKSVCALALGLSLLYGDGGGELPGLTWRRLSGREGLWSVIASNLVLHTGQELITGIFLLASFRFVERSVGSSKFAGWLATAAIGQSVLSLWLAGTGSPVRSLHLREGLASGPYVAIFMLLALYHFSVPGTSGLNLLAGASLLIPLDVRRTIPALTGAALGLAIEANVLGIKSWLAFPGGGHAHPPKIRFRRSQASGPRRRMPPPQASAWLGGSRVEADPAAVAQLVAMGFNGELAAQALEQTNNDVTTAINVLTG